MASLIWLGAAALVLGLQSVSEPSTSPAGARPGAVSSAPAPSAPASGATVSGHAARAWANFEAAPPGRVLWVAVKVDVPEDDNVVWEACDGQPPVVAWTLPPGWQDQGTLRPIAGYRSASPDGIRGEFREAFTVMSKVRVPDDAVPGSRAELSGTVSWRVSSSRPLKQSTPITLSVEVLKADATPRPSPDADRVTRERERLGLNETQAAARLRDAGRGDFTLSVDSRSGEGKIRVPGAEFVMLDPGPTCSPMENFNAAARPGDSLTLQLKTVRRTMPDGSVFEGVFLDGVVEVGEPDRSRWLIQLSPHKAAARVSGP